MCIEICYTTYFFYIIDIQLYWQKIYVIVSNENSLKTYFCVLKYFYLKSNITTFALYNSISFKPNQTFLRYGGKIFKNIRNNSVKN